MAIRSMMGVTWSPRDSGCSSLSHSVALNLPGQPQDVGQGTSGGPSAEAHLLCLYACSLPGLGGPLCSAAPASLPWELMSFWPYSPGCPQAPDSAWPLLLLSPQPVPRTCFLSGPTSPLPAHTHTQFRTVPLGSHPSPWLREPM